MEFVNIRNTFYHKDILHEINMRVQLFLKVYICVYASGVEEIKSWQRRNNVEFKI